MSRNIPEEIRKLATAYPDLTEGTSCAKVAFKVKGKSFVFVEQKDGEWNAMVKLDASLADAKARQKKQPNNISVGNHGWTTLKFKNGKGPPKTVLRRWIDESFRLLAPKKVVAELDSK